MFAAMTENKRGNRKATARSRLTGWVPWVGVVKRLVLGPVLVCQS
jgi:hypothetical protein